MLSHNWAAFQWNSTVKQKVKAEIQGGGSGSRQVRHLVLGNGASERFSI